MSEEIKTQHGTIGLLMAEVEQLRRDLGNAKHDLGLWAAEFDKQWPKDVKMTIANLKSDLAQAKHQTDLADRLAANNLKRVLVLEKELAQAKARQHQSDLNYDALEKQNKDMSQKLSGHEIAGAMLAEQVENAKAEIERLRQQISSEKVKP